MFCVKCGKQIEDDAVFCPFCGVDLLALLDEQGISNDVCINIEDNDENVLLHSGVSCDIHVDSIAADLGKNTSNIEKKSKKPSAYIVMIILLTLLLIILIVLIKIDIFGANESIHNLFFIDMYDGVGVL